MLSQHLQNVWAHPDPTRSILRAGSAMTRWGQGLRTNGGLNPAEMMDLARKMREISLQRYDV